MRRARNDNKNVGLVLLRSFSVLCIVPEQLLRLLKWGTDADLKDVHFEKDTSTFHSGSAESLSLSFLALNCADV